MTKAVLCRLMGVDGVDRLGVPRLGGDINGRVILLPPHLAHRGDSEGFNPPRAGTELRPLRRG